MNKIYKVIWSKAKHTYVVASEIAKGHTKGETTGKGLKKLAAAMLVATALLSPSFAWAEDMDVSGKLTAGSASVTNSISVGHNANVGRAVNAGSLNSRGNLNVDGNALVKGTLTSQSTINGKEIVSQTNITAKNKVVGMQGVVDNTLTSGNYVTAGNTVGENIVALDTQVKANSTALHISSSDDLIVGTKENQTVKDMKIRGKLTSGRISTGDITSTGDVNVKGKVAADGVTDETTKDGSYIKQNNTVGNNLVSLDKQVKANDERITNVKEYVLSETNKNYVSKTDAALQDDGAIVKKANTIGENVALLDAGLAKETAARLGADAAQDKRINEAAAGIASVNTALATQVGILNQQDANEAATRAAADTELNERITNEANAIHETTNQLQNDLNTETDERKAADTALDTRITNVKEYLEKQTSDKYVSKDDAAVQDGAIVKAANTIGDNVTKLDAALAKETAARIGADKAQDKVIEQVNQNMVDGFNTINKNMADGFTALNQADAALDDKITAETASRVAADTKLVEAVNSGVSLSKDNVLQKNTTTIDAQGNVTTSKTDAKEMILNKGNDNQITMNEKGIKVGTNSSVMDKNGVYTGGDPYSEAKAALKSDGSIKGADGKFTVNSANGTVNVNNQIELNGATGVVKSNGLNVGDGNFKVNSSGGVTAAGGKTALASDGSIKAAEGKFTVNSNGGVTAAEGKITLNSDGSVKAADGKFTVDSNGAVKAANGNTTIDSNGNVKTAGTLSAADGSFKVDSSGKITSTGLDAGNGTIQTTGTVQAGDVKTGTLETTGDATIGGDLDVKGDLAVEGEFNAKTLSSKLDENNYTTINGGKTESMNLKMDKTTGETQASASTFDETGSNAWAKDDDSIGKSSMTADKISQSLSDTGDNPKNIASRELSQNTDNKYEITDSVVDEDGNTNTSTQTASESSSVISGKDGENTYKSYITQNLKQILQKIEDGNGNPLTSVEQTEKDITNTAKNGTITNSAKDLVNTATGDITNTAKNGTITNDAKDLVNIASENMTNTVGKDLTTTVGGEMKTTVTGKTTENYNGGLETTVTGEEKHTVNGNQNITVNGTKSETVTGDVTEDYKANLSTTVGGNQTTTVTGDSSLTAENINNEAKNRITNKALDVETDAKSSILNKVSNDAGSNTSTQLSYQTTEKMSQADGKTASYLRGAAEEKSQLTDGDNKTTIDTIAGQTNTNITDGKKISNSLQNADKIASSVTDGTNTTVVNQDAKSLASSITDGTKANNTSSTVDKSEQLIKKDDTHYYAETKTAGSAVEALKSDGNTIIIGKDAAAATVSSAVTDGATITGISQNAKDINLSAAGGTIANSAKNISNTATEKLSNSAAEIENTAIKSITDKVGENTSWKMTDGTVVESVKDKSGKANQTTTTAADTYQFVKDGDNTLAKRTSSTNDNLNITDGTNTYTKITTATGNKQTVTDGAETASTNLTKSASNTLIENGTQSVLDHMAADTSYTVMNENGNGSRRQQTASEILDRVTDGTDTSEVKQTASEVATSAKDISNTATEKITSQIGDGSAVKSEMTADSITNITGNNTVTSNTKGTTFENTDHSTAIKEGTVTKTTISGNTMETGLATMDYADVMKDLGVRGNATIKGDTTMEGNASVGKNLTVAGTSKLTGDVTMENNASVGKNLTVKGDTEMDGNATVKKNLTVEGETNLKNTKVDGTLNVTGSSEFGGAATFNGEVTFKEAVSMEKDLSVGGNVDAASYTVKGTDIKIDKDGINAGGKVIRNVGQGDISEGSTDAVSGGQLYETNTRVSGLETRMGTVETKVDKLDNKIDKVGANAAAMANLHPLEFDEDSKWNIAAAVGSSGSETASAVGVFYRPNENVMVNASAAMGTGENMFGGGVSLRLGHGGNKAKDAQMKAAAKENRELRAKVDDLTARMDALLSVLNPNMSKDFPDVPENHWAYEAVSRLAGNGIVEGYEDGKYHGERQMTRYEMAEIIYNALSKGAKAEKKLVEEFRPELQAMAAQKKA